MGDIHGIIAQKLENLTENTGLQPILCATSAQLANIAQQKSPACTQAGDVIFLILFGQYRRILSADTASAGRQLRSQKRRQSFVLQR